MTGRVFDVLLGEIVAGWLIEKEPEAPLTFHIADSYRRAPWRPVLGQEFEDDLTRVYRGKRSRLPNFFANLVPEGDLRLLIEDSAEVPYGDDVALLEVVGADLPGAVTVRRNRDADPNELAGAAEMSTEARHEAEPDDRGQLRFSLPGVQLKFSMVREDDKLTLPVHGQGGSWIVKLESSRFPGLVANEYTMMTWAREAGFDVPECHIHTASQLEGLREGLLEPSTPALAIRRYDRDAGRRIHQEDFNQVVGQHPEDKYHHRKYEELARLALVLVGEAGYEELIRRLVFVILTANADAHLKNWSLLYADPVMPDLSPVYDQVCVAPWREFYKGGLALKLAGTKQWHQLNLDRFRRLADAAGANQNATVELVRSTVAGTAAAWAGVARDAPMAPDHVEALRAHWRSAPIASDYALAI